MLAGPFCTYQLAVLGAETIKIEEPGQGDIARQTGCDRAQNRRLMGTGYLTQGSNKRCLTLDLKDPRGRDILKRLVVGADVLVENFRAGAMARPRPRLRRPSAINPRLIYCSMTGFGQDGPKAEHNAYDCVIQAISGLMSTTGWPGGPPVKTGAPVIDYASGLSAAFAVSSALFQRERTGRGQYIDCAMLDAAMMLMSSHLTACSWSGVAPKPRGNDLEYAGVSAYETKDGVLMLGSFRAGQHKRLWEALGRPDLAALSTVADQEEHREVFAAALREIMLTRTAAEWEEFLAGIHVPGARMRNVAEALELKQVAAAQPAPPLRACPGGRPPAHGAGGRLPVRRQAGRAWTRRPAPSAPTPTRCWASSGSARRRLRPCARPTSSDPRAPDTRPAHPSRQHSRGSQRSGWHDPAARAIVEVDAPSGPIPGGGDRHCAGGAMKVFRRILHATDFSSASRPALAKAIALAGQNRAQLQIVHVLAPLVLPAGGDFAYIPASTYESIEQQARQHAQKQLAGLVARARKAGVRATAALVEGSPHEQVPRAARRARADLLVIGTHGRTGVSKLLLGSVAERLVRVSPCPVLTVRGR